MANQSLKKVVIVGRPNVGKSTLFNRLAGKRRALTHDLPGMTRDRLSEIVELDDGSRYELTDTGGLEYGNTPMSAFAGEIRQQAERALTEADFIVFVVDGAAGVLAEDRDIAQQLRPESAKTVLVVNKTDRKDAEESVSEFWELGFERVLPMSAEHGDGVDDLIDAIGEIVDRGSGIGDRDSEIGDRGSGIGDRDSEDEGPIPESRTPIPESIRVAIIGRPNVGKSSLLNKLTQEERAVVSPISGTTRDAIDSEIVRSGRRYTIVDTAGIRRKGKTTDEAEKLAVISARKAIERCEIALVLIDATEGATAQDATVAGYAEDAGKAAMLLVNKWDAGEHGADDYKKFEEQLRFRLKFLAYAPLLFISAKSGRNVEKIFPKVDQVVAAYRRRFRTSELNAILERAVTSHQPPAVRGKPRRFYYVTQLKAGPPTFALFSNVDEPLHFSYRRYIENQFRDSLGLVGCPVHLVVRARKGMKRDR